MEKLFSFRVKLSMALCALLLGGTLPATADDIVSGEYYHIINNNTSIPGHGTIAFNYLTHQLQWANYDATAPEQIFRLVESEDDTYPYSTDDGGYQYYQIQNLATGEYYSGQYSYDLQMSGNESTKLPLDFAKQSNGTYLVRTPGDRHDGLTHTSCTLLPFYAGYRYNTKDSKGNTITVNKSYARDNYLNWWQGSSNTYRIWQVKKVTTEELNAAKLKMALIDAYSAYNQAQAFNVGTTGLITNATSNDHYGTGSQFFATYNDEGEYAYLIDGNTGAIDEKTGSFFSVANNTSRVYYGTETKVTAPQFLQVDLGEGVTSKGVQMKLGLRSFQNTWGCSGQPADITLYATNDKDAAFSDFTIDECAADDQWTKIGESKLTEEYSVKYTTAWGIQRCTWNGAAANTYITENFGLKNTEGYRYLRFYVNKIFFPRSLMMQFTMGEFQLYNLDNIETPEPKKLDVQALLSAISSAEADLKTGTTNNYAADLESLSTAIDNLSKRDYVAISDLGYASFYSEENVIMPEGLTAYTVTANDGTTATLTEAAVEDDVLPAETPVILKGAPGNYELEVTSTKGLTITGNLLSGNYTPLEQTSGTTYYVLSKNSEGKAALMKYNTGNVLHSGKAYLVGSTASPQYINFSFERTTGIQNAVNEESNVAKTYDLEGRSVNHPQKGIYIRGGKKVILK